MPRFAAEAHFHERCRANYIRREPLKADYKSKQKAQKKALKAVIKEIECKVINKGQVLTLSSLAEKYKNELSITDFSDKEYRTSLLRQKLERHSISKHIEFSSEPLKSTLVYSKSNDMSSIVRSAFDLGQKNVAKDVASQLHQQIHNAFKEKEPLPWLVRPNDIPKPEDEIPSALLNHIMDKITYFGEFLSNIESTHPGSERLLRNGAIGAARSFTPGNQAQIDKTGEENYNEAYKIIEWMRYISCRIKWYNK